MDASMSQEIFTVLLAIMHNKALLLLLLQVYDHILQEWRERALYVILWDMSKENFVLWNKANKERN